MLNYRTIQCGFWLVPDDDAWQLLARSVTLEEFGEIAYLKPAFFNLDLRVVSDRKCIMHTTNGEAELVIGLPEGGELRRYKSCALYHDDDVNAVKSTL